MSVMAVCLSAGVDLAAARAAEPSEVNLEEIVVTARKRQENLQNVPDAITAFSASTLEVLGVASVNDLNLSLQNFQARETQQPGTTFITLRGVTMQRFQEPSVAVVVDGVQISSQYQILESLYDIERIEVLRGPQGSLYGRNAIGGAINITTKQPTNDLSGFVRAGYAEGNTFDTNARISGPIVADKAYFDLVTAYKTTDGLLKNTFLGGHADFEDIAYVRGRLKIDLSPTLIVDLRASDEIRRSGVGYFVNIPTGNVNDTSPTVKTGTRGIGTRALPDFSGNLQWDVGFANVSGIAAYSKVHDDFYQDLDYQPVSALDATQFVRVQGLSEELRITSRSDQKLRWLVGGYHADIDQFASTYVYINPCFLSNVATCPTGPVPPATSIFLPFGINQNNNKVVAGFGQINYDIVQGLELTVGLRYDSDKRTQDSLTENVVRQKTFSAAQPKVSLAYRWTDSVMTYATVSRGFRSGAFNGTDYITRGYDAETLWNYEVGAKTELLDHRARLNIAAFYMDYHNRQEYALQPGTGAQALFNVPKSAIQGGEIEATVKISDGFEVLAGGGFLDTKVVDSSPQITAAFGESFVGNRLPTVPRLTLNAGLQYGAQLADRIHVTARADWALKSGVHWSLGNHNDEQDSVSVVNARVILDYERLGLALYASNLFDRRYYTEVLMPGFGSINPTPGAFYARPRQAGAELTYRF